MPTLTLATRSLASFSGDTVIIGVQAAGQESGRSRSSRKAKDAKGAEQRAEVVASVDLPKDTAKALGAAVEVLSPSTSVGSTTVVPAVAGLKARKVLLVGVGDADVSTDDLRRAAGAAVRACAKDTTVRLALPHADEAQLAAIAEGALAGSYSFTAHKSSPQEASLGTIEVASALGRKASPKDVLARAEVLGKGVAWARDLVNTAPNLLYPQSFADEVTQVAKASSGKLTVKVLDDKELAEGGFGGIVGVGQGSSRPPRIVELSYKPARSRGAKKIGLVGKGITFDTGGVCIKPASGMLTMKSDMAGAAAVAATVVAAAELALPVAVTGYLCLAENMPGSNAQRPGDVVTMRNGTTVEIIDTDAEGRMVLADGMCLAAEQGAETIIDVATLTGAAVVALGPDIFAVMSNEDALRDTIGAASAEVDEPSWPLPLPVDLRKGLDSHVADLAHKADRWGGTLTAGLFLQEFAKGADGESIPWAHLDIAGPSFNEGGAKGHLDKGGTGVAVATLIRYLEQLG